MQQNLQTCKNCKHCVGGRGEGWSSSNFLIIHSIKISCCVLDSEQHCKMNPTGIVSLLLSTIHECLFVNTYIMSTSCTEFSAFVNNHCPNSAFSSSLKEQCHTIIVMLSCFFGLPNLRQKILLKVSSLKRFFNF